MKRLLIILWFAIMMFSTLKAQQPVAFSTKYDEFLVQLRARYELTVVKKDVKIFMDNFILFWQSPEMTDEYRNQIIATLNKLTEKKGQPAPDYDIYLSTYRSFIETHHDAASFKAWHLSISELLNNPRTALRNVNKQILIAKNQIEKGIIYSTAAVKWTSTPNNFTYDYKDGVLSVNYPNPIQMTCFAFSDSIIISDTHGIFYPSEEKWVGQNGTITWERAGYSALEIYATLSQYTANLDNASFEAENVTFYNKEFFTFPLKGKLEHKVISIKKPQDATYPKFTSMGERFKINNIHPNMSYEGGYSQHGARFLGSATDSLPAIIRIVRNDTIFVEAQANYFALRKELITSNDASVKINLDSASIYHPGLIFKFMTKENELHLIRNGEGLAKCPYFDTYHNISIDVELIKWNVKTNTINFQMLSGAAHNYANFESLGYYRESFYNQLQGMDAIHPLQALKNCSRYFHGQPFSVVEFAKFLGMPHHQVRQQVMNLSFYGFITYNVITDIIEIRERLDDYLLFRLGKKDFDVIRFNSTTDPMVPNAQLDLFNFDLSMNGVSNISICDHQNVVFFPKDEKIMIKQNRNFTFDGSINAGMLNLYGNSFKFTYDKFRIDLEVIDSMRMQVQTGELDYFGQPLLAYVKSTISDLSGYLQIDKPDNKSGRVKNEGFPVLKSDKPSHVNYEKPEIHNNAYKKDKFYFALDTFTLNSVNTLTRKNISFPGEFTSNIFPNIKEVLVVRNDFSLGFKRTSPPEGYPAYAGKAQYYNEIDLSNKGLHGNGKLTYITSTSLSEDFLFLPDQVKSQVHQFTVDKQDQGVEFPDVTAKYVEMDFHPYSDNMDMKTQEENFVMYNTEAQLKGTISVQPSGLVGKGTFYMLHGSIVSPSYSFNHHALVADSSTFNLSGGEVGGLSFNTTNLISSVDFETRMGTFVSKNPGNVVEFTDNRYISFIDRFTWNMDKNYIFLGEKGSKGNRFVSVHKKQDSLDFYAPLARYDVALKLIEAEDVTNIIVADADIKLKSGIVRIHEDAVMDPLDSTTIRLNNNIHTLYNAKVNIEGKKMYRGNGWYDFINGDNQTTPINFSQIEVNKEERTTASGEISASSFFTFDKHFAYKGGVNLNATDSLLTFNGGAQLLHKCEVGPQQYLHFESQIDPHKIRIPIEENLISAEKENLFKDFFLTKDSIHMYSSFIEGRKDYSDMPVITGKGVMYYNNSNRSFDITTLAKIDKPDTTGTVLQFLESGCNVYGEGNLNMSVEIDPMYIKTAGSIYNDREKNKYSLSTLFGLDFYLTDPTIEMLRNILIGSQAKTSELSAATFEKRLAEWVGIKAAKALEAERKNVGESKVFPDSLMLMFVFSNIDWFWNTTTSSYISNGSADIALIDKYIANKKFTVKAELMRKRSGNSIDMFIEADKDTWFYLSFKAGIMQVVSSNNDLNMLIQTTKSDERKWKGSGKQYSYILAPDSKAERFKKRIDSISAGEAAEEAPEEEAPKGEEPAKETETPAQ